MESLIQVLEWKAFEPSNITVSCIPYSAYILRVFNFANLGIVHEIYSAKI